MSNYKLRKVRTDDLNRYKELTDIEGWNLGMGKLEFVFQQELRYSLKTSLNLNVENTTF